jgi:hypothetical protein
MPHAVVVYARRLSTPNLEAFPQAKAASQDDEAKGGILPECITVTITSSRIADGAAGELRLAI